MAKVNMGDKVRDTFTGYMGYVHGIAEYITGCTRIGINTRKLNKDGKEPDSEWFDDIRVELLTSKEPRLAPVVTGGPSKNPAMRRGI